MEAFRKMPREFIERIEGRENGIPWDAYNEGTHLPKVHESGKAQVAQYKIVLNFVLMDAWSYSAEFIIACI